MDGPSTIRALRRIDPQIRVIATSGLANRENLNEARVDAQAILQKPFTTERLLEALDSVLTRGEEAG
jgi:CheY-like chemotaxis protein